MPTEEAFAPIYAMQSNMLLATIFLTLLAGGLTWWMLKHQLAPALTTIKTLATLADVDQVPQPLPITRQDEIGDLIDGFNRLLETLGKREEALQESDERNRTLFSRAADGIFIMTTDGMLTEVNESFARMHGYSTDEMLLMSLKDFDTPATAQLSSARMGRLITGETLAFEVEHYHRDGHIFPLEVSASQISAGGATCIQCFHRDITERKRIEEETVRSASEMAIIAEIGRVVSSTLDLDQMFERVAAETQKLIPFDRLLVNLKKTPDGDQSIVAHVSGIDNPGRRVGNWYPIHGTTTAVVMNTRVGILVQPADPEEIKDLYPILYETFKTGLRSALSVPLISMDEAIGSMNFRSKKLKAYTEQDLRLAEKIGMQVAGSIRNAELFKNLSQSEGELKKSQEVLTGLNAQIQSKNKELEQVVYVASHDLRSPLVNIAGYGREMEYSIATLEKAFVADHTSRETLLAAALPPVQEISAALRYIRGSAARMDALLTGLLKLSRSGRAPLTVAPLDMNELISGVVAASDFQIRKAGVELHVAELPPCRGDALQVSQVFANLLGNALKYLDPNRPGVIRISGAIDGERAVYFVEDNGIGIAPAHQNKIFELFQRLEPLKSKGEGLGLAIVRQALGRLEGEVRVESKPGEGSRFFVALPAVTM